MNFNFVAKIQLKNLIFHFLFITKINENNIKVEMSMDMGKLIYFQGFIKILMIMIIKVSKGETCLGSNNMVLNLTIIKTFSMKFQA
jgi:hypothetical protein